MLGKRKAWKRKNQRRVPIFLREKDFNNKETQEEVTTDVVYVLTNANKKKQEAIPTFMYP